MVGICKISKNFNTQIQYGWLLKSIYQERKKVKPRTWLFGISWYKVISALYLFETVQETLIVLTRGVEIVNPKGRD